MSHPQQDTGSALSRATESDRPRRSIIPTAKLTDASNSSRLALKSHQAAADAQRAAEARKLAELKSAQQAAEAGAGVMDSTNEASAVPSDDLEPSKSQSQILQSHPSPQVLPSQSTPSGNRLAPSDNEPEETVRPPNGKRKAIVIDTASERSSGDESTGEVRKRKKKASKHQKNKPGAIGGAAAKEDGIFSDIELTGISSEPKARREDVSRDIREFFDDTYTTTETDGKTKQYRNCKICSKNGRAFAIVQHNSTLRRHIESAHEGVYNRWCKLNHFASKLPNARKVAKKAAEDAHKTTQDTLDGHLRDLPPERVIPYSDKVFREAAVEWLIVTDQPLQAFEHPSFQKMIGIAARANKGVTIPNRKATREETMNMFKTQMTHLKNRLMSDAVTGEISLTCDAWQASNTDGYFAVTGHWIEEPRPGVWELHSALLGFMMLNNAHNGKRLGGALFKIVERLSIAHQIGHITCDNASNNNSMMEYFATYVERQTKKSFAFEDRRIRCLAHVINLATQALIKGYSKLKYYSPAKPDEHIPDVDAVERDEVGLIRAIAVKERSSAKRKELFRSIQSEKLRDSETDQHQRSCIKQLILDMPVRWSSTYGMLHRAVTLQDSVDTFVSHMARDESDRAKRAKLDALQLSGAEWDRVKLFLSLLKHADAAQQAFSSENGPSLHLALPALEALHNAWSSRARKYKYYYFESALGLALETITKYYDKTSTSNAFIMAMLLHPKMKMNYFTRYWDEKLHSEVRRSAETIFKERHEILNGELGAPGTQKKSRGSRSRFRTLLHELESSDEDEASHNAPGSSTALNDVTGMPTWLKDFNVYLNTTDEIPEGQTLIQWWGINAHRYPVWASLARDYLAVMASSVSSERAFSSAGITISKRRSRLKGDIVEALQCLKCMIHKNLIFRLDPAISIADEIAEEDTFTDVGDNLEHISANKGSSATSPEGWDDIWLVLEDEADDTEG